MCKLSSSTYKDRFAKKGTQILFGNEICITKATAIANSLNQDLQDLRINTSLSPFREGVKRALRVEGEGNLVI